LVGPQAPNGGLPYNLYNADALAAKPSGVWDGTTFAGMGGDEPASGTGTAVGTSDGGVSAATGGIIDGTTTSVDTTTFAPGFQGSGDWYNYFINQTGVITNGQTAQSVPVNDRGQNPIVAAKLQLNGHDRFSQRFGRYFNFVQPYQHHTNIPAMGINTYSFGLKPEEHQPSGTCNMSRIDNATLQLSLTSLSVKGGRACKVRVYAVNYNVLRIMSGMGGLAYSNTT
jgi:hypothetical protein